MDVYVLPAQAATQLISAREKAFFVAKAAGADDIIDLVVPRAAIPQYMAAVAAIAEEHGALITGCGHVGDGNVHLSVFQPDPEPRTEVLRAVFRAGMDLGGAISGEHGIGTEKKKYFLELEDPVKLELMRADQARLRPQRDPRARQPPRLTGRTARHERRPGTHPDLRRQRGRRLLRQPRDLRDALRRRPRRRPRDAGRPRALRGGGHRGGRRLRPDGAAAGGHVAAPRARTRQRHRQPPQRPAGPHPHRERGRRPRHQPHRLRPAAGVGHREPGPAGVAAGSGRRSSPDAPRRPTPWRPSRARSARRVGWPPWWCRPTCRGRRPGSPPPVDPARSSTTVADDAVAARGQGPAARASRPCSSWVATPSRERGLEAASRVAHATGAKLLCETFPARLERGAGIPPVERLGYLAEFTIAQLQGARHLVLADALAPVSFFAYPGHARLPRPRRVRGPHPRHGVRRRGRRTRGTGRRAGRARRRAPRCKPSARPERPTGRARTPRAWRRPSGPCSPRGRWSATRATPRGSSCPVPPPARPRHDWLCLTGGAIGQGLPVATGAAVACPDRPVLSLEADGSAMYTLQSLWTQVREGLDVTTVISTTAPTPSSSSSSAGWGRAMPGPRARGMLDLKRSRPRLRGPGHGHGRARRPGHARPRSSPTQLERAFSTPGPGAGRGRPPLRARSWSTAVGAVGRPERRRGRGDRGATVTTVAPRPW